MPIDKTKITKEMMIKAAQCETAEELEKIAGGGESGCHHMPLNKQCDHTYGT